MEFVWRNENKTKRATPEWSVDAFLDTSSTVLITHWSQEYIYKQTHEYKELCYLKTLSQFLKADTLAIKKIELLYKHMMNKEVNIVDQEFENKDKIVDLNQFKKSKKSGPVFTRNITNYLDSIYYEKHFLIFGEILKNKSSIVMADFFNYDEIKTLIDNVEK